MAEKYLLRVTAGPGYDEAHHVVLPVNTETPTSIVSDKCTADVTVRVQNFRGLPHDLPTTSPYFAQAPHLHDQYSIAFDFTPHVSVSANSLVWGNDFDRPIRDRLPPGFGTAFKIVKWVVDPGLDGDVYADKPYLYGPALASLNTVCVGPKAERGEKGSWVLPKSKPSEQAESADNKTHNEYSLNEGWDNEDAEEARHASGCPDDAAGRRKWALYDYQRVKWEWEAGRVYRADFFNPYLDFNTFSLKLPGFTLGVLPFLDGKDSLRYVLKDKETDSVFFVVVFTLVLKEDLKEEHSEATGGEADDTRDSDVD